MGVRIALFVLAAALFAIGHAVMFPQGALANLFGWATPMGTFEPVRVLVGLFAVALGAVTLLTGLQPKRRKDAEDLNVAMQASYSPKPIILTETAGGPLAPFPAEAALQPTPPQAASVIAAAVAPVAPPEPEAEVEPAPVAVEIVEEAPLEMTPPLAVADIALEDAPAQTPQQAVAASLREVLSAPAGERRRAQLRQLSEQVAALAASLAALADDKRDEAPAAEPEAPSEDPVAFVEAEPVVEPEPEPEIPPAVHALEEARAALAAAPFSLSAKSALAAALESAPDAGLEQLEEAVGLRRQVARVSFAQEARLDLAASVGKLAAAHSAAGDMDKARGLLSESLADLKPLVAQSTRYADLVYEAKRGLAGLA